MKMASRRIDLISKKTNCTCSTLFYLSLAVVLHDYNAVLKSTTQFFEAQLVWGRGIQKLKKGHPLRLPRWPEQLAACFLCRARVRTSDFRFAAQTFLDFSNSLSLDMLNGYFF